MLKKYVDNGKYLIINNKVLLKYIYNKLQSSELDSPRPILDFLNLCLTAEKSHFHYPRFSLIYNKSKLKPTMLGSLVNQAV